MCVLALVAVGSRIGSLTDVYLFAGAGSAGGEMLRRIFSLEEDSSGGLDAD